MLTPPNYLTKSQLKRRRMKKFIWDKTTLQAKVSDAWKSIDHKQYDTTPIGFDELFGEDSIHDQTKVIKSLIPKTPGKGHTVEEWKAIINEAFHPTSDLFKSAKGKKIRDLSVRMASSDPMDTFELAVWQNSKLVERHDTVVWTASYQIFGAPWSIQETTPITPERGEKRKGVEPTESTEELEPPKKLFLSKPIKKNKITSFNLIDPSLKRKHTTFFKIKFPKTTSESMMDMEKEFIIYAQRLINKLMTIDISMVILPWHDDDPSKPITRHSQILKSKEELQSYVDRIFTTKGFNTWCRMLIGHDKKADLICEDQRWFRSQGMWIGEDDIQVKDFMAAGWLLGSHTSMNTQDLTDAIKQHPKMENIPIAIRFTPIRLKSKGKIPFKEQVKAAHVVTDVKAVSRVRSIMREIYKKDPGELGYPLGIVLKFVPNIADPRYRGNVTTRTKCKNLKAKQKQFLNKTIIQTSTAVQGIDYVVSGIGSLRKIVMGLQASEVKLGRRNLFISVEEKPNSNDVTFIFREEYEDQAVSTIQALPLILQEEYGPRSAAWLGPTASEETAGWSYDKTTGLIKSIDDEYTTQLDNDWEESLETKNELASEFQIILNEPSNKNHFDDNGTFVSTGSLSGWESAMSDDTSMERLLKRMERLMPDATPEQKQRLHAVINGESRGGKAAGGDHV